MSRSYYKTAKCPFCVVNHRADSKFRKSERRRRSQYYRAKLREQLLNGDIVDLLYSSLYDKGFKNSWSGPSDGHVRIYKRGNNNYTMTCNGIYNKERKEYWYNKYKRK